MHVTHIVSTYPPYRGGMGNVAFQMIEELKKRGYKTRVLTPGYEKQQSSLLTEDVFRVAPWFSYGNSAFVPNLYSYLEKTDLLHLHYPFFGGAETVAWYKKKFPQKPLVISYHMDVEGAGLLKAFFQVYRFTAFPWIIKKADAILVSSMDYAEASSFLRLSKYRRVIELPFGVGEDFHPVSEKMDLGKLNLLFVGGLDKAHYFKGLKHLISACKLLTNRNISFQLRIIGDGDLRSEYENQVHSLGLNQSITFLGKVGDRELISAYQQADVTILPSIDRSEAFGLVLIESMACGTPVIASNLPGVRSVVDNEVTGLLADPRNPENLADKIHQLALDEQKRKEMGKNANKRVETFYRWPKITDQLEEIYKSLL